jgi:hypothetical protein
MRPRVPGIPLVAALSWACGSDGAPGVVRKPPADPTVAQGTTAAATETGTTTEPAESSETGMSGEGQACSATRPCPVSSFCVAPDAGGAVVGAGDFVCSPVCVDGDDAGRWCLDDSGCCDATARCTFGLCRLPSGTEAGDSSGTTAGATSDSSGG